MPRTKRKKTRLTETELRRRQAQEARRQMRKRWRRILYLGAAGIVGLLVILSFVIPELLRTSPSPETGLPGFSPESMESPFIAEGAEHEPYTSTPPVTGPHYDDPAEWGIYDTELPDERVLRNLELTGVAISYNLEDQQQIDRLKALVESQKDYPCYLLLRPYSKLEPGKVAVGAWNRLEIMTGVDEKRFQQFIDAFHGNENWGKNWGLQKPACSPKGK